MKKTIFKSKIGFIALMMAGTSAFCACNETETVANEEAVIEEVEQEAAPEMSFDEKDFEFGEIMQGDKVEHTFKFTNTGKAPLVISNARASCGCTVPQWPKEAIAPGAEGEIHVVFNSRGKSGRQNKSIRITTNIGEEPVVIYLKGNVKVPAPTTTTPSGN